MKAILGEGGERANLRQGLNPKTGSAKTKPHRLSRIGDGPAHSLLHPKFSCVFLSFLLSWVQGRSGT